MLDWITEIYYHYSKKIPFNELRGYIGHSGNRVEWIEEYNYPSDIIDTYRYKPLQRLIDNELILKKYVIERIK